MKIAFVRRDYTVRGGGAEKYLVTLSQKLAEMGEEIHIFAHTFDQPPHPKIQIHPIPMIPIVSPLKNLSFASNTQKELKKSKFDIICSLSRGFYHDIFRISDGLHPFTMKERYKHSTNYILKTFSPRHRTLLYLEKKSFYQPSLTRIIANSHLVKAQVLEYYDTPEEKIDVIYNGIDPQIFNPQVKEKYREVMIAKFGIRGDEIVILFVGLNLEIKGLQYLIEALSLLNDKSCKLLIVGKDESNPYLRMAETLNVRNQIKFIGYHPRIEEIYGMGDMLVLPSLYEPFSNCCLEAMACGIPVITTKQNGASELVTHGENGFIVNHAGDVRDIAHRVELLLSKEVRIKMGEHAFTSVKDLTIKDNARKVLTLFHEVLEERTRFLNHPFHERDRISI